MLIEPNETYIKYVETHEKLYLNCPKYILNEQLHSLLRMYGVDGVFYYLVKNKFNNPKTKAKAFAKAYENVKIWNFDDINVNSYLNLTLEQLPVRVQENDKKLNTFYESQKPKWGWAEWAIGIPYNDKVYKKLA